ncbi:MAG TPA: hypothetical protein ENJ82_12930 [Bacteroidetes bacterium]|nr:hypothetical protein [Bacteroidota bacterium]
MTTRIHSNLKRAFQSFLFGVFYLPLFCFSQNYNGGFETLHPSGAPIGWARSDVTATAVTSGAYVGEKAIKAWINDFYRVGIWRNYSPASVAQGLPGASADKIPGSLSGFYWYDGSKKECETALITVFAGTKGANGVHDTLAFAEQELRLNKGFVPFSFPIAANSAQKPDFVAIKIEPRGKCYYRSTGKCCYLTVDELRFDQDIELVEATVKEENSPWTPSSTDAVRVNPDKVRRKKNRKVKRFKRKKREKRKKDKGRFFKRKKTAPETIPVKKEVPAGIQAEIDRINKYQKEYLKQEEEESASPAEMENENAEEMDTSDAPEISEEELDRLKMSDSEIEEEKLLRKGFEESDESEEGSSEDDEF